MSMQNKTVVITGATSGIGEVAAMHLAEQGARIIFTARDQARADETLAALRKARAGADQVALDTQTLSFAAGQKMKNAEARDAPTDRCGSARRRERERALREDQDRAGRSSRVRGPRVRRSHA